MRNFDYSKIKERKWDNEILNYLGLIHEYKGRQELYFSHVPDKFDTLVEIAKRQSTEASNEIEGIKTAPTRLKQLIQDKVSPKNRDENEILGYRNALNVIHENYECIPLTPNYILQLHKELYSFMEVGYGGRFKDTPNEIDATLKDGSRVCIFKPLDPFETPDAVRRICEEYGKAINNYNVDPLVAIPIFIHDFLCIHPFNDGNGRMSRLLTTLLLYKSGYVIGKYISLEKKILLTKSEYYDALSNSSANWGIEENDDTYFVKYMLGIILSAYRDFEDRIDLVDEKITSEEMVIKAIKTKFGKFTKTEILELCPKIRRATVENVLKELVDKGQIERIGAGRSTAYVRKD